MSSENQIYSGLITDPEANEPYTYFIYIRQPEEVTLILLLFSSQVQLAYFICKEISQLIFKRASIAF